MTWTLEDSTVDALELPDELKLFARQMAGESVTSVDLTSDRERILLSAALEVELYVGKMYFTGAAGSARSCTSIVEVAGPGSVPAIPQFPRSTPVNITSVMRWDDAAAAFVTSEYVDQAARRDPRDGGGHVSAPGKRHTKPELSDHRR